MGQFFSLTSEAIHFLLLFLADNEHLLSGQLEEIAADVAVLVFESDGVPCKDIVRHVEIIVIIIIF